MEKVELFVEMTIRGKLAVKVKQGDEYEIAVLEMLKSMSPEACKTFLLEGYSTLEAEQFSKEAAVKNVIDGFDPMFLMPGEFAPSDEYDPESEAIAQRVESGMSVDEIANIIIEVFDFYFDKKLTAEDCEESAEEIHYYLTELA